MRIPRLNLEVPVYDGTTDTVLDLAAGRIESTALPGTRGNTPTDVSVIAPTPGPQ